MSISPQLSPTQPAIQGVVACLCAGWCTTCEAFRPAFAALAQAHPEWRFVWVDIEDHADALETAPGGAPDIDNFPTLLLSQPGGQGFWGTILPQAPLVERLLRQGEQGRLPRLTQAGLAEVVTALAESPDCQP
ncbi:thioredoxin [Vitreoscilla filiformis]|uniref:Thioredoxin n=1 Tax=Vitreoscilla filiformis TaxID=63 RepID=A0A221KDF2_VITFI|nr:thioredoxin family protein [Vitreoscilla filiformis]ASM76989.1 thioredoxin [Vitreoscilla filiformis]